MKDTEVPEEISDSQSDNLENKNPNNYIGLKFALPVLGLLLLLVGITAGALLYQGPQTSRSVGKEKITETPFELAGAHACDTVSLSHIGIGASVGDSATAGDCYGSGSGAPCGGSCFVSKYTCPCGTDVSNGCQGQNGGTKKEGVKSASVGTGCKITQIDLYCDICDKSDFLSSNTCGSGTCSGSGSGATATPTRTPTPGGPTPTRTRTPTRTPTPGGPTPTRTRTPTRTPTSQPPVAGCVSYTVHETSGTGSRFLRYGLDPNSVTSLDTFCSNCDVEAMDSDGDKVYAIANDENKSGARLCTLNKDTGALSNCVATAQRITGLSFRSGTPWAWKVGTGLVTINLSTGAQTQQKSSSLDIEDIAWDNAGTALYLVKDASKELYKYNPADGSLTLYSSNLPTTGADAIDFSPDGWLVGENPASSKAVVFAYDVANKLTKASWNISTSLNNWDGMTAMCDLPGI